MKEKFHAISLITVLLLPFDPLEATTVRFVSIGNHFIGKTIYGSNFDGIVGVVGDLISIDHGKYSFYIPAPKNYKVAVSLYILDDGSVMNVGANSIFRDYKDVCYEEWEATWSGPNMSVNETDEVVTIGLPDLEFAKMIGEECSPPAFVGCPRRQFFLSVNSNPSEAEIWVDGENSGYRTPTQELVGSYCSDRPSVTVIVRKPGWINCFRSFSVYHKQRIDIRCVLGQPKKGSKKR